MAYEGRETTADRAADEAIRPRHESGQPVLRGAPSGGGHASDRPQTAARLDHGDP